MLRFEHLQCTLHGPASPLPHPSSALPEDRAFPPCWALESLSQWLPKAGLQCLAMAGVRLLIPGCDKLRQVPLPSHGRDFCLHSPGGSFWAIASCSGWCSWFCACRSTALCPTSTGRWWLVAAQVAAPGLGCGRGSAAVAAAALPLPVETQGSAGLWGPDLGRERILFSLLTCCKVPHALV